MRQLTSMQRIVRDFLIYRARRRSTVTYGELGGDVGRPARGPWATDFDAIRKAETEAGRPDPTWLVVSETTGLPRMYMGTRLDPRDDERVNLYRNDRERVYEFWAKTAPGSGALSTGSAELEPAVDIAMETGRRPCSAATDRQEREDQDFIDAVSDWDWNDE